MKTQLGKALAVTAAAFALTGLTAPAHAAADGDGDVAIADEPFVVGHWAGFEETSATFTRGGGSALTTDTAVGGGEGGTAAVD
ncbi:hypothetical protein [Streptomyces naphthomycinicus]|uniref:hypothetical protein n=1 Tax=Streptomyces naphthomycinicus TaxID=2872625 RepID=UPI001CECBD39|nr:hypothetical protein [Streptomyces sp. TML10]